MTTASFSVQWNTNTVIAFQHLLATTPRKWWSVRSVACTTDETKLWLSLSVKQHQNTCSGSPPVYQDFSMHHDWPVKKAIVSLPIRMRENLKPSSGQNKDLGAASQTSLTEVKLCARCRLSCQWPWTIWELTSDPNEHFFHWTPC